MDLMIKLMPAILEATAASPKALAALGAGLAIGTVLALGTFFALRAVFQFADFLSVTKDIVAVDFCVFLDSTGDAIGSVLALGAIFALQRLPLAIRTEVGSRRIGYVNHFTFVVRLAVGDIIPFLDHGHARSLGDIVGDLVATPHHTGSCGQDDARTYYFFHIYLLFLALSEGNCKKTNLCRQTTYGNKANKTCFSRFFYICARNKSNSKETKSWENHSI